MYDTLADQLRELVTIRHPNRRLTAAELDQLVREHLGGTDPERYGSWVCYPWSRRMAHLLPVDEFREVRSSRNQYKMTDTAGCGSLEELRGELSRLRLLAGDAARRAGASLVSVGAPPFEAGPLGAVTDETRYRELAGWFPDAVLAGRGCACQVRIEVMDRDQAVDVLARIRPWLPALLALTVNSPFADGRDTGWASYRYHLQQRWPTFRPPGAWDGADRYDSMVRSLILSGAAPDESAVYFLARVPADQAVVEVRVADACLTVEDSVIFAGIVRALVRSLITDARRNLTTTPVPTSVVDAHLNTAALGEVHLRQGRPAPTMPAASEEVVRLMRKIGPALTANGDADAIYRGMKWLRRYGTGADRQRRARHRRKDPREFVRFLAGCTAPNPSPADGAVGESGRGAADPGPAHAYAVPSVNGP